MAQGRFPLGRGPNFGTEALLDVIADSSAPATFVGEQTRLLHLDYDLRRIPLLAAPYDGCRHSRQTSRPAPPTRPPATTAPCTHPVTPTSPPPSRRRRPWQPSPPTTPGAARRGHIHHQNARVRRAEHAGAEHAGRACGRLGLPHGAGACRRPRAAEGAVPARDIRTTCSDCAPHPEAVSRAPGRSGRRLGPTSESEARLGHPRDFSGTFTPVPGRFQGPSAA